MREVSACLLALAVLALGAGLVLEQTATAQAPGTTTVSDLEQIEPQGPPALQPVPETASGDYPDMAEEDACPAAARCHRQGCISRYYARWAEAGSFNCTCRGSYKFPVPPQYTYHWPGMYSQQTMTEYASPYRFPPLKAPPVEKAEPKPGVDIGPVTRHAPRQIN